MMFNLKQALFGKKEVGTIFDNIEGHEDAKATLMMALKAVEPVHILLVGPMGIAKTEMLIAVQKYVGEKNSHFAIGSRISKAGISDLLYNRNVEYLFIDEMETMPRKDQAVLLSVQQHGIVSETLFGKTKKPKKVNTTVFATSNDTRKIMPALLTRFYIVKMDDYDEEQFIKACLRHLQATKTPNINKDVVEYIATNVFNYARNPNVRDVGQIAKLSQGDQQAIDRLIGKLVKR